MDLVRDLPIFSVHMAAEKTIIQLYTEHEHSFIKHLKRAKNLEEKEVHKLRVEIKNLRVLFEFLQALTEKDFKFRGLLKLLKPVFKKAGGIRTAQLNLTLSRPYRSATMLRFREYLREQEKKTSRRFLKYIKTFDTEKLEKLHKKNLKAIKKFKPGSIETDSESYIRNILAKIRTAMFDVNKDRVLHEIRKHLKTIKNMGRLLKKLKLSPFMQGEIKKIALTYDKIGKWHDDLMLADTFENYILKKDVPETREKALAFVLTLREKNEKAKLLLIKKLRVEFV